MAVPISSRSPLTLGAVSNLTGSLDRRKTSNSLKRAARDAEVQQSATVRRWLSLGDYFSSEKAAERSRTNRNIGIKACARSSELRTRSASLVQKSRGLRERARSNRLAKSNSR